MKINRRDHVLQFTESSSQSTPARGDVKEQRQEIVTPSNLFSKVKSEIKNEHVLCRRSVIYEQG